VITRRQLARALARKSVADWVVIERQQDIASIDDAVARRRRETRSHTTLLVHVDVTRGRGTARIELRGREGDANAIVDQAVSLATTAIGPSWKALPPAAPARVALVDPALEKADLTEAALGYLGTLERDAKLPKGATMQAAVSMMRERVYVQSRIGARADWSATLVHARALVAAGDRSLEVTREARKTSDLELDVGIRAAVADLGQLATAGPPAPGQCAIVLAPEAHLHGGEGLGVWSVFAAQADPTLEREGLTRYRLDSIIAPGAEAVSEPLSIDSNGAIDFATRSAPVGDSGDAVRRFGMVDRGRCAGLGLDGREAALRKRDPNGGVRNLVVAAGTWDEKLSPDVRVVEIRRLRALAIDPYTGDASLELALAIDHQRGDATPFTGGTVRLDLIAALARARRSRGTIKRGPYHGPSSVLIDGAELIG
jgi:predicted Zn-dependent protease